MIAGVALLAAGAVVGAIALIDGGDSPAGETSSQAAGTETAPDPIAADPAEPESEAKRPQDENGDPDDQPKPRQADFKPGAATGAPPESNGESTERDRSRRGTDRPVDRGLASGCPPPLSRAQCAALARDFGSEGSEPAGPGCPNALSESECAAIQAQYEGAGPGDAAGPDECPPGLTRRQCEQLAAAIGAGG